MHMSRFISITIIMTFLAIAFFITRFFLHDLTPLVVNLLILIFALIAIDSNQPPFYVQFGLGIIEYNWVKHSIR